MYNQNKIHVMFILLSRLSLANLYTPPKNAAPDDGDSDRKPDQTKDCCENSLFVQGNFDLPEDGDGKTKKYGMT